MDGRTAALNTPVPVDCCEHATSGLATSALDRLLGSLSLIQGRGRELMHVLLASVSVNHVVTLSVGVPLVLVVWNLPAVRAQEGRGEISNADHGRGR